MFAHVLPARVATFISWHDLSSSALLPAPCHAHGRANYFVMNFDISAKERKKRKRKRRKLTAVFLVIIARQTKKKLDKKQYSRSGVRVQRGAPNLNCNCKLPLWCLPMILKEATSPPPSAPFALDLPRYVCPQLNWEKKTSATPPGGCLCVFNWHLLLIHTKPSCINTLHSPHSSPNNIPFPSRQLTGILIRKFFLQLMQIACVCQFQCAVQLCPMPHAPHSVLRSLCASRVNPFFCRVQNMKYDYIFVCWQIFIVLGKMPQEKPNKKHKDKEDLQ